MSQDRYLMPSAAELLLSIAEHGVAGSARRYAVTKRTIANWRARYGLPAELQCHKVTPPPRDELRELYAEGFSTSDLAANYGVSQRTVLQWMTDYGLKRRAPGFPHASP